MTSRASFYGSRERTQRDKLNDCVTFICNARPAALLAMTAERLCADKGVSNRQAMREVEVKLLAAQKRERRRESAA